MKEKELRADLKQVLQMDGWHTWFAPRVRFLKQQDIFSLWDFVYAKKKEVRFGQFTTLSNKSSHIKKIKEYRELTGLSHTGYLFLWDGKKRVWKVEKN